MMQCLRKFCFSLWLWGVMVAFCPSIEAVPPPLVADADLVGNVYGTVVDSATQEPLAGAVVALFETPLQPAAAGDAEAFHSDRGWFIRPPVNTVRLQTITDAEGNFLINNVSTPYPAKAYTIVAQKRRL